MQKLLSPQSLLLLIGGAALVGTVLTLSVFLLQRSFSRPLRNDMPRRAKIRVEDEGAFALTTIKSVVTQLKSDQKTLQDELAVAERRAEENARKFELIAREIDLGVIVFNAQGYISFSNPLVRKMLVVDTWSRRRYAEIFNDMPALADLIGKCFESVAETRNKSIKFSVPDGSERQVEASVLPTRDRSGTMESVICIFRELTTSSREA
jgi:PAS domain-containing protein